MKARCWRGWWMLLLVWAATAVPAWAHVGSKDVFEQVESGPYRLYVTVRTPVVIPGVATVEVRTSGAAVKTLEIAPVPMVGEASKHPPTPDAMKQSAEDPAFFTGSIWIMASGSWQVRITGDGAAGRFTTGVPVPAMPTSFLPMQRGLGLILGLLGMVLVLGMVGIVAGAVREARLEPGVQPNAPRRRRAVLAGGATLVLLVVGLWLGNKWWNVEASSYAEDLYHPSDLRARLDGDTLKLQIGSYDKEKNRWEADAPGTLLLDHGKVMHLYAIRWPEMDAAFHLHPQPEEDKDTLSESLPAMPPGTYHLYADIVRRNGFPETLQAELTVPAGLMATPLAADDAKAAAPGVGSGGLGTSYKLPDGYTMVWDRPAEVKAGTGYTFRFKLLDAAGQPAKDMEPYLGMAGHAAWVKTDGTVFAHTHPEGSAAMPAMMMAEAANGGGSGMSGMDGMTGMDGMPGMGDSVGPVVEFPYGFPTAGNYRVFVQMKHAGVVETGVFDVVVR